MFKQRARNVDLLSQATVFFLRLPSSSPATLKVATAVRGVTGSHMRQQGGTNAVGGGT